MLNVGVSLDRIVCNAEPESSAEPYMCTSFLHADANTIFSGPGHRVATTTPHANWTTRGAFPNGISAGDSVDIPPSLGEYQVVLDPGALNIALLGTLFVLMEQDSTPGYAIRAGHEAFAQSVDSIINGYVDDHFPSLPDPSAAELEDLASQIQGEVLGAIKDELSVIHLVYNHDNFCGFGYLLLADLPEIAVGGVSTSRQFSSRTAGQLPGPIPIPYDYDVEFHVTVGPAEHSPDSCPTQVEIYNKAAAEVQSIDGEIERIRQELHSAKDDQRAPLRAELRELQTARRPVALDLLDSSYTAYQLCRKDVLAQVTNSASKDQRSVERATRLAKSAHGRVPVQATVAATTAL